MAKKSFFGLNQLENAFLRLNRLENNFQGPELGLSDFSGLTSEHFLYENSDRGVFLHKSSSAELCCHHCFHRNAPENLKNRNCWSKKSSGSKTLHKSIF